LTIVFTNKIYATSKYSYPNFVSKLHDQQNNQLINFCTESETEKSRYADRKTNSVEEEEKQYENKNDTVAFSRCDDSVDDIDDFNSMGQSYHIIIATTIVNTKKK